LNSALLSVFVFSWGAVGCDDSSGVGIGLGSRADGGSVLAPPAGSEASDVGSSFDAAWFNDPAYANLPVITPGADGTAKVGPDGGHVEFPGDIVLDIPAGALTADTFIQASPTAPLADMSSGAAPVLSTIALAPDGLQFMLPVRMRLPMPRDPSGALYSVSDLTMVSTVPDDGSGDCVPFESVPLGQGDRGKLDAFLAHFSTDTLTGPLPVEATVGQARLTSQVKGLSSEILKEFMSIINPDKLVDITTLHFKDPRSSLNPEGCEQTFLQQQAADDLRNAIDSVSPDTVPNPAMINIRSAWRSVADQLVLQLHSNGYIAVGIGESPHLTGKAIDVKSAPNKKAMDACKEFFTKPAVTSDLPVWQQALEYTHPVWGEALSGHGFKWQDAGKQAKEDICSDPVHFTATGIPDGYKAKNVQAFQNLWNKYRPCDPIPQEELEVVAVAASSGDGVSDGLIPETRERLKKAPASGFLSEAAPLPNTNTNVTICCPGSGGASPSCQPPTSDLALNLQGSGFPSPAGSSPGWGGGNQPWEILTGQTYYTDTWAHGLAFTGGATGYGGEACGMRQATVDFGNTNPKTFNRVFTFHHGTSHIPNQYHIEYCSNGVWVKAGDTSSLRADLAPAADGWSSEPTESRFPAVTASRMRFVIDTNCDIEHGWIYSLQVFLACP
jgi:hypothetical protein